MVININANQFYLTNFDIKKINQDKLSVDKFYNVILSKYLFMYKF